MRSGIRYDKFKFNFALIAGSSRSGIMQELINNYNLDFSG